MRTFTDDRLTAYTPDYYVYRSDRVVIQVKTENEQGEYLQLYMRDGNGLNIEMIINLSTSEIGKIFTFDITDIVMSYVNDTLIFVSVADRSNLIDEEIEFKIAGLANPKYLPPHPFANIYLDYDEYIAMPSRILRETDFAPIRLAYECRGSMVGNVPISYGGGIEASVDLRVRNEIPTNASVIQIYEEVSAKPELIKTINLSPLLDCKKYACVRWVGRTGVAKVATWEVREVQEETEERLDILTFASPANNMNTHPVDVRKKYNVNLHLYLDGLTAYDYWYYCDIVNSPKVEVFLTNDESNVNVVDVLTKSVTFPDSDVKAPYDLDVEIKLNEYGAY